MKMMMKKHALTISISAALILGFVIIFIAAFGNTMRFCSCGALYNFPVTVWGYMPKHYHLKGDNWNKLPESPESYFKEAGDEGVFKFQGYGGDVKIPNSINGKPVKSVSFNEACWNVTGVYFPNSVTAIPEECFAVNKEEYKGSPFVDSFVEKVFIPNSVTEIGARAFAGTNLKSITVPGSVTKINEGTFESCTSLKSADIGSGVTEIGENAFNNCTSLTDVIIPDSVTTIDDFAFAQCNSLTNITIPDSVTEIGEGAFDKCTNLSSITYKKTTYDYVHINDLYTAING